MLINEVALEKFRSLLSPDDILLGRQVKEYVTDRSVGLEGVCEIALKPRNSHQISEIVKISKEFGLKVVPRGGGTGVVGGAIPTGTSVLLSLENLNMILSIDSFSRQVVVESGVLTSVLRSELVNHGLYFPVNPGFEDRSFIGGNVATNAGGYKSAKYGVMKDYVINLEVVLPSGDIVWTGSNTSKSSSGYNLTSLFVGSEGTIGIITKVVLKALPRPSHLSLTLVQYDDFEQPFRDMERIVRAGLTPSGLELMLWETINASLCKLFGNLIIEPGTQALLFAEVDGMNETDVQHNMSQLIGCVRGAKSILQIPTFQDQQNVWLIRNSIGRNIRRCGYWYTDVDVCVPRSNVLTFVSAVEALKKELNLKILTFGHLFDGNFHNLILREEEENVKTKELVNLAVNKLFEIGIALGGVISGEHGIGLVQRHHFKNHNNDSRYELMLRIKHALDPADIFNPGKIFVVE